MRSTRSHQCCYRRSANWNAPAVQRIGSVRAMARNAAICGGGGDPRSPRFDTSIAAAFPGPSQSIHDPE